MTAAIAYEFILSGVDGGRVYDVRVQRQPNKGAPTVASLGDTQLALVVSVGPGLLVQSINLQQCSLFMDQDSFVSQPFERS